MKRLRNLSGIGFLLCSATFSSYVELHAQELLADAPKPIGSNATAIENGRWMFPEERIEIDANFPCSRLHSCTRRENGEYDGVIRPENEPINDSPWFAFKISAAQERSVIFRMKCLGGQFRYIPKVSTDGIHWVALPREAYEQSEDNQSCLLRLEIGPQTLWIAAQEIVSVVDIRSWAETMARLPFVALSEFGKSKHGQPLFRLDLGRPDAHWCVSIIGRQHPPETTGSLALMRFVEELASDTKLARDFREKFHVAILPILNPDGVERGHWRHNLGGVDLNRDWGTFYQPETRAASEQIIALQKQSRLCLHLDFHSTNKDVFYTQPDDKPTSPANFTSIWLDRLQRRVPDYKVIREASENPKPNVSANWVYQTFGVPGITYEIGDNTDRALLKQVATSAAQEMMSLLLELMAQETP